uniref:Uncharacterized protein n=1 Tax=Caulobacter phage BL57 TaxID=3348355 RepID=A0AB74UIG9_9VIRU
MTPGIIPMIPAISHRRNDNCYRWYRFDPKWRRIPLHRRFGGYMPKHVEAKDMWTSIGHGRLERRTLEKDPHAPAT